MGAVADALVRIAEGKQLTPLEIERMRLELANIERAENVVRTWAGAGTTDPYFANMRASFGEFDSGPLYCAAMCGNEAQSFPDAAYTDVIYDAEEDLSANLQKFNYDFGIATDPATGTFSVRGTLGGAVLFCGFVNFAVDADGHREIRLRSGSGGNTPVGTIGSFAAAGPSVAFSVVREIAVADDTHKLQVYQNSGGALLSGVAVFCAVRVR